MIARLIAWSARNLLLVLFGTGFAAAAGLYALVHLPLDAIPDLSDTQVIVYTEYPGQAPQVIEDQVTYPLTTAMLTVPKSKVVRGFSFFGVSFVYVIFEDGTDIYWARSRVLGISSTPRRSRLPAGVTPTIGPDATGVGWVYQYAVMSKELNLADTRTHPGLESAVRARQGRRRRRGGQRRRLRQAVQRRRRSAADARPRHHHCAKMRDAIRASNARRRRPHRRAVRVRVRACAARATSRASPISSNIVLKASDGTPVLLRDVARVELGPTNGAASPN